MSKRDDLKIDIISGIDEDIIDKNLKKRFFLWAARKKRNRLKIIPILVAAVLLITILGGTLMFMFVGEKKVPVYTGMTVHQQNDAVETVSLPDAEGFVTLALGDAHGSPANHDHKVPDEFKDKIDHAVRENHPDVPFESPDESTLKLGINDELYYANQNEDIYITIHFDNPDNFEILSFTFNGEKYASYMFEYGSTMENIIIKRNVGDAEGVIEYTIDAIKYVDGTEIKDVKMEGDRTVEIGVYSEKQPLPIVSDTVIGFNDISFKVDIADELGLIDYCHGELSVMLYDGEEIIATEPLVIGETNEIRFEGLKTGTAYTYAVVGVYDALDKQGVTAHILLSKEVSTNAILLFNDIKATDEKISFSLLWNPAFEGEKVLNSLVLYRNGEKACDIDPEVLAVDGLLSNSEYTVVAEYMNGEAKETIEYTFKTKEKAVPTVTLAKGGVTQTNILFTLNVRDPDDIATINKIELLHGDDTPVVAESTSIRHFGGLLSNHEYTVKVSYSYDLNDGSGVKTEVLTLEVKTLEKQAPRISLNGTSDFTSIDFSIIKNDPHSTATIEKIELLHGDDAPVIAESTSARRFEDLLSNHEYTVKLSYSYDLNDGSGVKNETKSFTIKTVAKKTPSMELNYSEPKLTSVDFNLDVFDPDQTGELTALELLCEGKDPVNAPSLETRSFTNLEKLKNYTIKATYKYDLNDGTGEHFTTETFDFTTQSVGFIIEDGRIVNMGTCTDTVLYINTPFDDYCIYRYENGSESNSLSPFIQESVNKAQITEIHIGENAKYLPASAFSGYENVRVLTLPNSITKIGVGAFRSCSSLQTVVIPESVTSLGASAFAGTGLTSITISGNTEIGESAFSGCINLQKVTMSKVIGAIGQKAFYNCKSLQSITIPEGVTSIGESAFENCSLTSITISGSTEIGNRAFYECTSLQNVTMSKVIGAIGQKAFYNCTSLQSITIPEGVTSIGESAFENCSLTSITISGSTEIGNRAFYKCTNLQNITMPNVVGTIGKNAFYNCTGLQSLTIPKGVTIIDEYAFSGCTALQSVTIFEGVTNIEKNAFSNCDTLESVSLPTTIKHIGDYAFSSSEKLDTINFPDGLISIGANAFWYCNLTSVHFPDSVQTIGEKAFSHNPLITITLPKNIKIIEAGTFERKYSIMNKPEMELVIPEGVTTIKEDAFAEINFTKLTLPSTLEVVDSSSFSLCKNLYIPNLELIFKENVILGFGYCHTKLYVNGKITTEINVPVGTLCISEYAFFGFDITKVIIPSTVTSIGHAAFGYCDYLTEVSISNGVQSIGQAAFRNCISLKNIIIPESVTSIGTYAFTECEILETVVINANVSVIDESTFYDCDMLKTVYLPSSVERIRAAAFTSCNLFSKIVFDGTVEQWNNITLVTGWKASSKQITVQCTNGSITV